MDSEQHKYRYGRQISDGITRQKSRKAILRWKSGIVSGLTDGLMRIRN